MSDTISRQAAIDAVEHITSSMSVCVNTDECHGMKRMQRQAVIELANLPSAQPEQRWIPCSERLPEEGDYKSCIECLDGAVWYFTENGTMGIGYYYESTKEWSTTDDLKTDGKVVAWMPLPEPYQEDIE